MEIVDLTPLTAGIIGGRVYFPDPSLTIVVKGTFDLRPDESAELSQEQAPPTGDEPFEDGDDPSPSLRYASDMAYFKPRADLLLVGKAHAPDGQPVPRLRVRFRVGEHERALAVFGDRWWDGDGLGSTPTDPVPFESMDLRYENAFGGADFNSNPVGKGRSRVPSEWGYEVWPLPNVEDPARPVRSPSDLPFPAGFGPLDPTWEGRASRTGSYRGDWLHTRWPWFPEDFDWRYFNAAPPEMQVAGYLRGDEGIYLENLDPELPRLSGRLPGLRIRCFLNEDLTAAGPASGDGADEGRPVPQGQGPTDSESGLEPQPRFREVPMHLDTLWVDAEERKLVLVWRGVANVVTEDLDEIEHLFIRSEALEREPLPLDACRRELEDELARREAEAEGRDLESAEVTGAPAAGDVPGPTADEMDAEVTRSIEQMNEELLAAGAPPVEDPSELSLPSAPSPEAEADSAALLEEYGVELHEEPEAPSGPLAREDVEARLRAGEPLSDLDLTGVDLSEMDLSEADLHGSILVNAVLRRARMDRANLTRTTLKEADLSGASLREADLTDGDLSEAVLAEADLSGAVLGDAILEGANLRGSRIEGMLGQGALLPGADLTGAVAVSVVLQGADLTGCRLDGADFRGANLSEACLEGASAVAADFSDANLRELQAAGGTDFSRASFRDASAIESIWSGSRLVEADLAFAKLEGAELSEADLSRADLTGTDMRFARLDKAVLVEARMIGCNLFEASLERAALDHADLTGASLYGAEVLGARFEGTSLDRANLKMTKFQPR